MVVIREKGQWMGKLLKELEGGEPQCRRKNQLHTRGNWPFPNIRAEKDG